MCVCGRREGRTERCLNTGERNITIHVHIDLLHVCYIVSIHTQSVIAMVTTDL